MSALNFFSILLTEGMPIQEYLNIQVNSPNAQLVKDLIARLYQNFGEIPESYFELLQDIAKFSSITGYMQVTTSQTLQILKVSLVYWLT